MLYSYFNTNQYTYIIILYIYIVLNTKQFFVLIFSHDIYMIPLIIIIWLTNYCYRKKKQD